MSDQTIRRGIPKRYVTRREMLAQATARAALLQEALGAINSVEATPAPAICHFEALWRVCAVGCLAPAGGLCSLASGRAAAQLAARLAVQSARLGA
jgi:hypothetical protein